MDPETGQQKTDKDGRKLTLQDKKEQQWNLDPGFLTARPWRKGDSLDEGNMTYYQKTYWKLQDGCTVLDLSNFDDDMFYHVCLDSKFVANSLAEYKQGKWRKATHYIAHHDEEEQDKFQKNQLKSKAYAGLHSKEMTLDTKKLFCYVLDLANTRTDLSEDISHNLLFKYIEDSTFSPGSNLEKFNNLFSMLKSTDGKEQLQALLLLKQAVDHRVIYEKQDSYKWNRASGVLVIGETKDEALEFLTNPKKAALVEELVQELKAKQN